MLSSPKRSTLISGILHALVIVAVVLLTVKPPGPLITKLTRTTIYEPPPSHVRVSAAGGGGGGQHSPLPVSHGNPPPHSPMVITPPIVQTSMRIPELPVAPTILGPMEMPTVSYQIGLPTAPAGPASGGPGSKGGLGGKDGIGVGPDSGVGTGPGPGGPGGPGGLRRGKMTLPELLTPSEPEYTEEARRAKLQGTVGLTIVVSADGRVTSVEVTHGLGLGLDERAIETVKAWRFRPATMDGKPIPSKASVDVTFRLL